MIKGIDLVLEITRKCNMNCSHCLRGKQENRTMSEKMMDKISKIFTDINILTLSGGEPSLVPDRIIKSSNTFNYDSWFVVTNGNFKMKEQLECNLDPDAFYYDEEILEKQSKFLHAIYQLNKGARKNDISYLAFSCDRFHNNNGDTGKSSMEMAKEILEPFKIEVSDHSSHYTYNSVMGMGNGTNYNPEMRVGFHRHCMSNSDAKYDKEMDRFEGLQLYINVYGQIYICSNLSYDYQRKRKLMIGSVNKPDKLKDDLIKFIDKNKRNYFRKKAMED